MDKQKIPQQLKERLPGDQGKHYRAWPRKQRYYGRLNKRTSG